MKTYLIKIKSYVGDRNSNDSIRAANIGIKGCYKTDITYITADFENPPTKEDLDKTCEIIKQGIESLPNTEFLRIEVMSVQEK